MVIDKVTLLSQQTIISLSLSNKHIYTLLYIDYIVNYALTAQMAFEAFKAAAQGDLPHGDAVGARRASFDLRRTAPRQLPGKAEELSRSVP